MKFTKAQVKVIEQKTGIKLTDQEIDSGKVKFTKAQFGSVKEVMIYRNQYGMIYAQAHFKDDDYLYANGAFEKADARFGKFIATI